MEWFPRERLFYDFSGCPGFSESDKINWQTDYRELKKSVPRTYDKGIIIQLRACDKVKARKVSSGVYSITYTVDWEIYNPNENTYRLQREYADYIIYKSGGTCKLDRLENWEILSKEYF